MNITFIHFVEIIVVLLIVAKSLQIRKLYADAEKNRKAIVASRRKALKPKITIKPSVNSSINPPTKLKAFQEETSDLSRRHLPLPDVSYSDGLPLPDVSYLPDVSNLPEESLDKLHEPISFQNKMRSSNEAALNSYIEDMFFESSFEFTEEPSGFKSKPKSVPQDDEFIIVAQENALLARELQRFNQNLSFARH